MATLNLTQISKTTWEWDDGDGLVGEVEVSPNARNPEANAKTSAARDYHAAGGTDRHVYFDQITHLTAEELIEIPDPWEDDDEDEEAERERDRIDCALLDRECEDARFAAGEAMVERIYLGNGRYSAELRVFFPDAKT